MSWSATECVHREIGEYEAVTNRPTTSSHTARCLAIFPGSTESALDNNAAIFVAYETSGLICVPASDANASYFSDAKGPIYEFALTKREMLLIVG